MIIKDDKGTPVITRIGKRAYVVCAEPVRNMDGHLMPGSGAYCGALIDVTDKQVKATMSCGCAANHRSTWLDEA